MRFVSSLSVAVGLIACGGSEAPAQEAPVSTEAPAAPQTAEVGQPAPDFTLTDLDGQEVTLSSFGDKTVVLEWFNPGCPFVKHAYEEGPLAELPGRLQAREDVVWLAVNSGAPGKQGHGLEVNQEAVGTWSMPQSVLLDPAGTVGKLYGAKTTPHMYIVHQGTLAYAGALDNAPLGEPAPEGSEVVNYVDQALQALDRGEKPSPAQTKPYGCSVKYGS